MIDDANLWSGVYRSKPRGAKPGGLDYTPSWPEYDDDAPQYPTVVVTLRPCYWSLPFSWTTYGCLLGKPGFTFGFLCVYVAWSRL